MNLILRTTLGERAARSLLGSIEIELAAHATDAVPQGHGNAASASGKHDLTSRIISGLEISNVLFAGEQTYIIWKPTLHLPRPKVRLQRPAVYFTAIINLASNALNASKSSRSDVLQSYETLPTNVLEPLQFDAALRGSSVYLPEDRITKVLPASATAGEGARPIRGATKRAFPILPALFTRVRYSVLPDALTASLHLETSQLVGGSLSITDASLDIRDADVRHLASSPHSKTLFAGDEVVNLYKLIPRVRSGTTTNTPVSVKIKATVNIERNSSVGLEVSWQAHVDLTKVALKPTYKWSRPLSGGSLRPPSRPSLQAGNRPSSDGIDQGALSSERGMTFNFTAQLAVTTGEHFTIGVHCINRSNRTRRFALVVLHARRQHPSKHLTAFSLESADLVASIFNAPHLERTKSPDVLDLNPDVRIGPLPPGAVFETHLKYRAMASGSLDLGVIRIVDLDTRQTVDVRELPDIIALESAEKVSDLVQ